MIKSLIFFTLTVIPLFSYLDPSTGGMVVSAIIGFFATIFYTMRKYFYKMLNVFSKKKSEEKKEK